jgi:hypothetical protein
MGIHMYINDQDIERWSSVEDSEVNELLQDARKVDPAILIHTWHTPGIKRIFKNVKPLTLYSIRINDGKCQAKIMNFPSDLSGSSINTYLTKAQTMIYLYGFLNGSYLANKPTTNEQD